MGIEENDSERKRVIILSLVKLTSLTRCLLSAGQIYVYFHSDKGKIIADAYSSGSFETPHNPRFSHQVFNDSNFIGGKEIMHYNDFIDVLVRLNNGKIADYTLEEGISAIEKIAQSRD